MDFDNDDELSSFMAMEQEQEDNNISIPTQTGRTHPPPHDPNKYFAWRIYKLNKNKGRRPTCRTESCYKQINNNGFEPPPPPPPAPTVMAYGGKMKKRGMGKKQTRKNKYSSKKSKSNRFQKKTRKYK